MMIQKEQLISYTLYHDIYQTAKNMDEDTNTLVKQLLLKNSNIDKNQTFFYVIFFFEGRSWDSNLCFFIGEAKARAVYTTHKRTTKKFYLYELEPKISFQIKSITLKEILDDEIWFDKLIKMMAYLVPLDIKQIQKLPKDRALQMLWSFEYHIEEQFVFYDGKEFLFLTNKDATVISSLSYGYSVVIDDSGRYGIIHNKTKLLSDKPEFEWVMHCNYHYIKIEDLLAEVQRELVDTDDFREYLCDIVDLETKKSYTNKALCNSLDSDRCIIVYENLLKYIMIDTQNNRIKKQSKSYLNIITPGVHMLKPVQSSKTKLWGYIDKECNEVISPRYKEYAFFNDGYAVMKENGKEFVIDKKGEVVIPPFYDVIEHYKDDYFFVKKGKKGAVFKSDKIYIDFFDLKEKYAMFSSSYTADFSEDEIFVPLLRFVFKQKKSAFHNKLYKMALKEYIGLFDTFKSQMDLVEAGLWWHPVKVKELSKHYEKMIKKKPYYTIGWCYPANAGMFDFTIELPVVFEKKDGSSLTLGIEIEKLEMVKRDS